MKNKTIDNMIAMWDGTYMGINFIRGIESYLYLLDGPRSIIINFDVNEKWNENLDFVVSKKTMKVMIKMEDLFSIPCLITVNYNDRQSWVKVMDVYIRLKDKKADMTSNDDIYIPKEIFKLLIKAKR